MHEKQELFVDRIFLYENNLLEIAYGKALEIIVEGIYLICAFVCI